VFIVRTIGAENAEFLSDTVGGKQFPLGAKYYLYVRHLETNVMY